mmetsp:Transcript_23094/g.44141  ORF Transcript_23094/g.44141 Transcript_23094/m.44141 type:complete len:269 (+) Transcript_23094:851-1657(+)
MGGGALPDGAQGEPRPFGQQVHHQASAPRAGRGGGDGARVGRHPQADRVLHVRRAAPSHFRGGAPAAAHRRGARLAHAHARLGRHPALQNQQPRNRSWWGTWSQSGHGSGPPGGPGSLSPPCFSAITSGETRAACSLGTATKHSGHPSHRRLGRRGHRRHQQQTGKLAAEESEPCTEGVQADSPERVSHGAGRCAASTTAAPDAARGAQGHATAWGRVHERAELDGQRSEVERALLVARTGASGGGGGAGGEGGAGVDPAARDGEQGA